MNTESIWVWEKFERKYPYKQWVEVEGHGGMNLSCCDC